MPAAQATVATSQSAVYLARLGGHAGKMSTALSRLHHRPRAPGGGSPPQIIEVRQSGDEVTVVLDGGQWTARAVDGRLLLRAEAPDAGRLKSVQDLLTARLAALGRRERLSVAWESVPGS